MWTEFHLKEVEDLVEVLFGFIVIEGFDVLDLIVYSRVEVFLDDKLLPDLNDFIEKCLCFAN